MLRLDRRSFLKGAVLGAAGLCLEPYHRLAAGVRGKVKITDVKCMIVRGTWDWNLIRIETDADVHGLGESYFGAGVKDVILKYFKPMLIGQDPFNVDRLYTQLLMKYTGYGAIGGVTVEAASGIEIALWDLVGRILETPVCNLLGGRFRDSVRFYRTMQLPKKNAKDPAAWRELVREARSEKWKWTAFKFQGDAIPVLMLDPEYRRPEHDPFTRNLSTRDIKEIVRYHEIVRQELGPDGEFAIDFHWHYDTRDAIELAKALEPIKPMWMEDPVPPENPEAMAYVRQHSPVPVCTGENLYTRHGFLKLIELQGCDGVHIDIPKSGGLLEAKRISDLADNYYIWTAAHNPASAIGTIASAHAASSMRNFRVHELANYVDWWPDLVIHEGPIWENGYLKIQDKPGYGIELNPDVARAHLAPGETWWG
jgi:L-alanine-DL-glutamate epimerase-like enolase superfamily enzyme